jgi:hypothetical protein
VIEIESGPKGVFDEIANRLDHPPLMWDPKNALDEDKSYRDRRVIGVVEDRKERASTVKGQPDYAYTVLRLQDGTRVAVPWWNTVLRSQIAKHDPQPGDTVGIEYMGSKPNSDPSLADIELYDVIVRKVPGRPKVVSDTTEEESGEDEEPGDLPMASDA